MVIKLSAFTFVIFAILVVSSHSASITNGKLLKFYPITREHYRNIVELSKKQPVLSEANVFKSHRSLADWSNTLNDNWNSLLSVYYNVLSKNKTLEQKKVESYPLCVIKTQNPSWHKRSGKQYRNSAKYAGLAPNVLFSSSYYGAPALLGRKFVQPVYVQENIDDEIVVGENSAENEDGGDESGDTLNVDTVIVPDINNGESEFPEKESVTPIINCVVVLRRKNNLQTSGTSDPEKYYSPYGYPQYPHYAYPYPPQQQPFSPLYPSPPIPPSDLSVHPYPPYPNPTYPRKAHHSNGQATFRNTQVPTIDPLAVAQYQRMIAKYYRHLHALYSADAGSDLPKGSYPEHHADDTGDTSNEKEV